MRTPQEVKEAAKGYLEEHGAKLRHVGNYNGYEVYEVCYPVDILTGFPIVFLYKEGVPVVEHYHYKDGVRVFEILDTATKNARERRKARKTSGGPDTIG